MNLKRATNAAIYVRISRDSTEQGLGVLRQRQDCEKLAAKHDWDVVEVFEDNDVSATSKKPRPAYQRMRTAIENGRVNAIVVWDVDRLTRSPRELEDVIDWADKLGLKLASVGGDIDLATEQGRMLARMKGTVARYETEQSSRRLKRKKLEMAEAGVSCGGPRPFGWNWDKVKGEDGVQRTVETVNAAEAAVVNEAIDRLLAGDALWSIVGDFNDRGLRTSRGNLWRTNTLRNVILRERNAGIRSYHGKRLTEAQWPAIVEPEKHDRIVAFLKDPARRKNNRGTEIKYLLTSKALCGACGQYLVGKKGYEFKLKNGRVRHYQPAYGCPHRGCMKVNRNMAMVDDVVEGVIVGVLKRSAVPVLAGNEAEANDARDKIAALEAKLSLVADQFAEDMITGEQLQRITAQLRPKIDAEKQRLRRAAPAPELGAMLGEGAAEKWRSLSLEKKRALIDAIGIVITIMPVGPGNTAKAGPESVKITWRSS